VGVGAGVGVVDGVELPHAASTAASATAESPARAEPI
jgi:hypothetical protein